jgi:hypothetical protein
MGFMLANAGMRFFRILKVSDVPDYWPIHLLAEARESCGILG